MNILIICSKAFYDRIPKIKQSLEENGHTVALPNCFDNPGLENEQKAKGEDNHAKWKATMYAQSREVISQNDAVLVLNFEKNGVPNYIGGATFLEMYDAMQMHKKIFLYNSIPLGILHDEISGFSPIVLKGDLAKV